MIKAEIRTDAGDYKIPLPFATTLKEGWKIVTEAIKAGEPFAYGGNELLVISPGAILKHIRVYKEDDDVVRFIKNNTQKAKPWDTTGDYILTTARCVYLGNSVIAKGQAFNIEERIYFLPMEINGKPALDMLNPKKLEEFVHYWANSEGLDDSCFTVVVPKQQLPDYEEALEYLKDYIKETSGPVTAKEKNATAWQGWKAESNEK